MDSKMDAIWTIRAVQLDLARQMETIEFIKEFIDVIAAANFNSLFLYLEGRVRTKSFNMPSDDESYKVEDMIDVVAYAESRNIDIIPCVSLHGHAEMFLQYAELADFAELRGNRIGRFWENGKVDFCPSHDGFKSFFSDYLKELCEIFPTKYFHIGLDEVWDVGYCDKCMPVARTYNGEQQLFLDNIKYWHGILSKLNKRVMMWDDMFEYYPDILEEIPRDVIMVEWQYQNDMRHARGHFMNLKELDLFEKYEAMGFQYLIAPSDYSTSNIRTATTYACKFNPMGGLVTSWEKRNCFLYKSMPAFVYAGILWHKEKSNIFLTVSRQLFQVDEPLFVQALRNFCEQTLNLESYLSKTFLLSRSFYGLNYANYENLKTLLGIFKLNESLVTSMTGKRIVAEIISSLCYDIIAFELKEITQSAIDVGIFTDELTAKYKKKLEEFKENAKTRIERWNDFRGNITPIQVKDNSKITIKELQSLPMEFNSSSKLMVRFCLPDKYSVPITTIRLNENNSWIEVAHGTFKMLDSEETFYEITFLTKVINPGLVEISVKGYGGQGVCYAKFNNGTELFKPAKLKSCTGIYETPEFFTENDCKWTFLGSRDTRKAYTDRTIANHKSSAIWTLARANI